MVGARLCTAAAGGRFYADDASRLGVSAATHNGVDPPAPTPRLHDNNPPEQGPATAATRVSPHLPALLSLGLMVGTINGLSRVAMPLFAVARGAQAWQVGVVGGLGYLGVLLMALPM